eukprot:jgi/Ulvmu1/583/UM001_0591.1
MASNDWAFNSGPRQSQDRGWFWAYVTAALAAGATGVFAWKNMNPLFAKAISDEGFMFDPSSCEPGSPGRRLLAAEEFDVQNFGEVAGVWIIVSVVLALAGGLVLIQLFRKAPQTMVILGFAIPITLCVALAIVVKEPFLIMMNLAAALMPLVILFMYRAQVKLVGRMMKVAADSLAANPALAPFAIGTNIVVIVPLLAFGAALYFLQGNGDVVPAPNVLRRTGLSPLFTADCVDGDGRSVACCVWQPRPWVPPVQVVVGVILMWTMAIRSQLRTYVIGGVVTQWYFHGATRGTTLQSVGHALGPARGTLCFSGAIITLCDIIRALAENMRSERGDTASMIISCICACILNMLQELIRFVSTLATIQAAATGEAFLAAARSVGEMMTRHSLSAVTVWWLPDTVLKFTTMGISATAGVIAYFVSNMLWQRSHRHQAGMDAIVLGIIVGAIWIMVLGWVAAFIRSSTEVVYVCFARDLDNRAVTRPEVHEVLKDVPQASGAVVVQPDNNIAYGAMEEGDSPSAPLFPAPTAPPPPGYPQQPPYPPRDLTAAIEGEATDEPHKEDKE